MNRETSTGTVTITGTVVIDIEACKGCDLCVQACPVDVLVMTTHRVNTRGYRYPELLPGCIGCKACSQICPDFVFQVYRYAVPIEQPNQLPIELPNEVPNEAGVGEP